MRLACLAGSPVILTASQHVLGLPWLEPGVALPGTIFLLHLSARARSSLRRTVAADFATIAVVHCDRRHAYSFELAR